MASSNDSKTTNASCFRGFLVDNTLILLQILELEDAPKIRSSPDSGEAEKCRPVHSDVVRVRQFIPLQIDKADPTDKIKVELYLHPNEIASNLQTIYQGLLELARESFKKTLSEEELVNILEEELNTLALQPSSLSEPGCLRRENIKNRIRQENDQDRGPGR